MKLLQRNIEMTNEVPQELATFIASIKKEAYEKGMSEAISLIEESMKASMNELRDMAGLTAKKEVIDTIRDKLAHEETPEEKEEDAPEAKADGNNWRKFTKETASSKVLDVLRTDKGILTKDLVAKVKAQGVKPASVHTALHNAKNKGTAHKKGKEWFLS